MKRSHRIVISVLAGVLGFYGVILSISLSSGVKDSGGPSDAYATDISCARYWFTLGLTWKCDATIVDSRGERQSYTHTNSALTPADIGKQVPMKSTGNTGYRSRGQRFATAEHKPGHPVLGVLGGAASIAAAVAVMIVVARKNKDRPKPPPVGDTKFL